MPTTSGTIDPEVGANTQTNPTIGGNNGGRSDEERGMSLEELVYGSESFHAVVRPGTVIQLFIH